MVWAAKTFRISRPIDDKRAKSGFYDEATLVGTSVSLEPASPSTTQVVSDFAVLSRR
jgi:hypothetical protein